MNILKSLDANKESGKIIYFTICMATFLNGWSLAQGLTTLKSFFEIASIACVVMSLLFFSHAQTITKLKCLSIASVTVYLFTLMR